MHPQQQVVVAVREAQGHARRLADQLQHVLEYARRRPHEGLGHASVHHAHDADATDVDGRQSLGQRRPGMTDHAPAGDRAVVGLEDLDDLAVVVGVRLEEGGHGGSVLISGAERGFAVELDGDVGREHGAHSRLVSTRLGLDVGAVDARGGQRPLHHAGSRRPRPSTRVPLATRLASVSPRRSTSSGPSAREVGRALDALDGPELVRARAGCRRR